MRSIARFDVKLFPQVQAPAAATLADRSILRELTAVRDALGASYVNFSMFDHATDNPSIQHFLTYPMCWITEYLRNYYTQTDPFNRIDFRGNPIIDWHEIYSSDGERELLRRFSDAGLGDSGISVAARSGPRQCGVLSATFRTAVNRWPDIRRRSLPVLCEASDSLTRLHARLFAPQIAGKP